MQPAATPPVHQGQDRPGQYHRTSPVRDSSIKLDDPVLAGSLAEAPASVMLQTDLPPVLLASTSPRRRQLLAEHGLRFGVLDPGIDDAKLRTPSKLQPQYWATSLAYLKASAAVRTARLQQRVLAPGTVVVGADTVVVKHGLMVSKPIDADDADSMIRLLRNGSHRVFTGVAMVCPFSGRRDLFADFATVALGDVPDDVLATYIASNQWCGKAGGYNLFERVEAGWPITWQGDATTIVGLPMTALVAGLRRFGVKALTFDPASDPAPALASAPVPVPAPAPASAPAPAITSCAS